ncbi:MAG: hypothetical protein V4497_12440 [Bacteroidota bacterium]
MPHFSGENLAYTGHNTIPNFNNPNPAQVLEDKIEFTQIPAIKNIFKIIFIGLLFCYSSCKNEDNNVQTLAINQQSRNLYLNNIEKRHIASNKEQFYYYSSANNKKYNYRVTGLDENGNSVNGVINLENEIAIGLLRGSDNTEIEIISEQINANRIIATDINGFEYKLKVDE